MDSLKGHLLIASPELVDPNFFRTVVLMIEHNEQGAFGLVLNRPTRKSISELWQKMTHEPCATEDMLYFGGPVGGPLMALHTHPHLSEIDVLPGVYLATEASKLIQIVGTAEPGFRIFAGHAGWGAGQLENELEENSWIIAPAELAHVFFEGGDLWQRVLGDLLNEAISSTLNVRDFPEDLSLN